MNTGYLVGAAGFEPATAGLEIRCSIRLSYAPARGLQSSNPFILHLVRTNSALQKLFSRCNGFGAVCACSARTLPEGIRSGLSVERRRRFPQVCLFNDVVALEDVRRFVA
jgi:hypothetical protein